MRGAAFACGRSPWLLYVLGAASLAGALGPCARPPNVHGSPGQVDVLDVQASDLPHSKSGVRHELHEQVVRRGKVTCEPLYLRGCEEARLSSDSAARPVRGQSNALGRVRWDRTL